MPTDAIRVHGAVDEGPAHEEIQYWWTARHIEKQKIVTLVTTSSESSYLNRAELLNGCLSLALSNTFIPSTLGGSCMDPDSGNVSNEKLQQNHLLAIEAYINRVNGCPCAGTEIQLFRWADSSTWQQKRGKLLIFLKGTKEHREGLQKADPQLYSQVWEVRNNHMVTTVPSQYVFFLVCCCGEMSPSSLPVRLS